MRSYLINMVTPSANSSALLVLGKPGSTIRVLHLLPENGSTERFALTTSSSATAFHHGGAREQAPSSPTLRHGFAGYVTMMPPARAERSSK
ncbi:hypothetical protein IF1G_07086 [Cordyceps javanica]|uniref:Uncharacterized protein n=1 Tax=Cordyceps javanica TaxID=43265 RepID=A0A545UXM2_9HYPO|nr:hypothetical protein IF1G_07086 [Cordyceps javanica]TQW06082.1 hypothetical protein IF2G_06365 [Cordyceps javanica]